MRKFLGVVLALGALIGWLIAMQPDDPHPCQAPPLAPLVVEYGER